jgi:hypothetical protein
MKEQTIKEILEEDYEAANVLAHRIFREYNAGLTDMAVLHAHCMIYVRQVKHHKKEDKL